MTTTDAIIKACRAGNRCLRICTPEEDVAAYAASEAAMTLSLPIMAWTAVKGVYEGLFADAKAVAETENPAAALFHMSRCGTPTLFLLFDVIPFLKQDPRTLRALRELITHAANTGSFVLLVDHDQEPPPILRSHSTLIDVPLPNREQIESSVRATLRALHRDAQVRGHRIETDLTRSEFDAILKNLQGLNTRQVEQIIRDVTSHDRKLSIDDLNHILAIKRRMLQDEGALQAVESPVSLDAIGGFARLKAWLRQREPALRDDAASHGLVAPRGVLLLGVQGAGKSLCAKAIATAWNRPLLRLDAGSLYDRYVGESESKLRNALRQAEAMAPIVLWIDEIEKAFASAASTSVDGGLSRRMFGAFLTWMQEHQAPVFLAATANDIEALPPELLRKGRFDEIFFVDLPMRDSRKQIFSIHLAKRKQEPGSFDLNTLADASDGFSGAEIEQAVLSALTETFAAKRPLTTDAIVQTLRASPPLSVTMREKVQALRDWAQDRCVPAE